MLAVTVLNFALIHLAPGDAVDALVGQMGGATPEMIAQIRADYGLDRPLVTQLLVYVGKMVTGNLGFSFHFNEPVAALIFRRVPATALLVLAALALAIPVGIALGVVSAQRPRGLTSLAVTGLSLVGYALPAFWTGIMLLLLFAYTIPLFPSFGMRTAGLRGTGVLAVAADASWHLVLPALTLASIYLAQYSRLTRASMREELQADYIRTARSKGVSEAMVVYRHALKNAVLPVVTVVGLQFGQILAGAVIVETVFSWPGLGQLAFQSILRRDHPLLLGILFFSTGMVVVVNILTDMAYRWLDPRIH